MNKLKKINKTLLFSGLSVLLSVTCIANANETNDTIASIQTIPDQILSVKKVQVQTKQQQIASYKAFTYKKDMPKAYGVYINNKQVAYFFSSEGGFTAEQRAKILVNRINQFVSKKGDPKTIIPGFQNGIAVGRIKDDPLFTTDTKVAESMRLTNAELARQWVNNIRTAFGVSKFTRDNVQLASRSGISTSFSRKYVEDLPVSKNAQVGMASWYGGIFNGRRAADGSRFNTHNFTAAHKTLPFGSVVKVTNLRNNRVCVVKITDRGPFIPGRIIDLSSAAAKEIGMFSSGISKVKVEVVR
jgi:hypothetical protein